jgi:putative membrane protein
MKCKFGRAIACVAVALTLSVLGFGQGNRDQKSSSSDKAGAKSAKPSAAKLSSADQKFVDKAAQGGLAEVQLGELAQQKSQDPKVKEFAQRMVTDHGKANDQLKSVASEKGITLPTDLDAKDKAEKDKLSKLSGEQFDKAYMNYMVKDHTKDVSEFQKESQSAKDPDVKSFASTVLPTIEDHLKQAKTIAPKERAEAKAEKKGKGGNATSASNPPPL